MRTGRNVYMSSLIKTGQSFDTYGLSEVRINIEEYGRMGLAPGSSSLGWTGFWFPVSQYTLGQKSLRSIDIASIYYNKIKGD